MTQLRIGNLTVGNDRPLTVIAGPCQLESEDHAQMVAGILKEACDAAGAQFIFKGSYDKANRTSLSGKRGLGIEKGLQVLRSVARANDVPVLPDVHMRRNAHRSVKWSTCCKSPPSSAAKPTCCSPPGRPERR